MGNAGRAALEGQAGVNWPGTEISGQLAKVACSLGRLACGGRSAGLTYLSHPRNGREDYYLPPSGATHSPEPRAGAACGAETQGLTANRRSGGADQEGSPAFALAFIPPAAFQVQDRRGEGRVGPEVSFSKPEEEFFPGCSVDIFQLLLVLRLRVSSRKDGVRKM